MTLLADGGRTAPMSLAGKHISTRREMPLQTRLAPIESANSRTRTAELLWTSGASVQRYDYFRDRPYVEELSLDPAHVRMNRLGSGNAPLLDNHSRSGLASVIGVVLSASLRPQPTAMVQFSARDDVTPIWQDVQDKILRNVSVGYFIHRIEMVAPADGDPQGMWTYRAVDWEPFELSLVPVGADPAAQVIRGERADERRLPCEFTSTFKEAFRMDEEQPIIEEQGTATRAAPTQQARTSDAIRERAKAAGLSQRFADLLVARNLPFADACAVIVDEVAERAAEQQPQRRHDRIETQNNADAIADTVIREMSEALHARHGGGRIENDGARQYLGLRVVDMGRQLLELRGVRTTFMSPNEIVQRNLHSTSDFPNLLSATANKSLRQAYNSYPGGARLIARKTTAPDFKSKLRLNLGEAPSLQLVRPGSEIQRGTMAEAVESYSLQTYARIFGITRQALINDDLSAFVQLSEKYGRAAAEFEAGQIVSLITSNPVMNVDSTALFHANHGNLDSASAISVASLGSAKQKMRLQKGLDGKTPIDATPRYLLVPAALEVVALQYVTQITPALSSGVNPFSGQLEVVVDPRLDTTSGTQWYVASDPGIIDTIEYAYLEGSEGVYLESRMGFDVEGMEFKARVDFGCGVLDFRGLFRNG